MSNAGSSSTTAVRKHETEFDGWHEPIVESPVAAPVAAVRTPPRRPASEYEAAVLIARWIERRFDQVFWRCERCDRESPYATAHYHAYVSNFGICASCHNETRDDDLQRDFDDIDLKRSRFDPDYSSTDNLHWVGPRHARETRRVETMHNRRLDPLYLHRKRVRLFKAELMEVTWHPSRVAKWLEQGEEVLDMMMGV